MTNWNNKKVVFVSGCTLCPYFQAVCSDKNMKWQIQLLNTIIKNDIGIIQMPCPEASFGGYKNGTIRKPHGVDYYEKLEGFKEHCNALSQMTVEQIKELLQADYCIIAIIGIEHSPTCAANYMYTHHGMMKRKGIFLSAIYEGLISSSIEIPILGINRSYPDKCIQELLKLFEEMEEKYAVHKTENIKLK